MLGEKPHVRETYPRDEVVGAPDARDLVLVEELGDGPLGAGVDLHEEDVADVREQQQQRLPPQDHLRTDVHEKLTYYGNL